MTLGPISPSAFVLQSDEDLGAVQVTTFISLVMFGVLLSQAYVYFSRNKDGRPLQWLVAILLFLETCHSFTTSQTIYFDTVTRYLTRQPNSYPLTTTGTIENLITTLVQSCFIYRVYRLSDSILLGVCCSAFILFRFVGGMTLVAYSFIDISSTPNGINFVVKMSWLITSSLACGAAADVLIAASMLYYLRQMESPRNRTSTSNIINRLVRFSLQTGLITSMTSVAVIISFQAMQNMVWFGFYVLLAKVYSNSLLVSLNTRASMRREVQGQSAAQPSMPTMQFASNINAMPLTVSFVNTQASIVGPIVHSGNDQFVAMKTDEEQGYQESEPCQ